MTDGPASPRAPTALLVVLAAVFLLVVGILTFGMGLLLLLGGAVFDAANTYGLGDFGGLVAGFALLVVAWAVVEIVASIGMFGWRRWGRVAGIVVGIVGLALTGPAMLTALGAGGDDSGPSLGFNLGLVAGYGLTLLALIAGGRHFRPR